jgi:hypothetical protein
VFTGLTAAHRPHPARSCSLTPCQLGCSTLDLSLLGAHLLQVRRGVAPLSRAALGTSPCCSVHLSGLQWTVHQQLTVHQHCCMPPVFISPSSMALARSAAQPACGQHSTVQMLGPNNSELAAACDGQTTSQWIDHQSCSCVCLCTEVVWCSNRAPHCHSIATQVVEVLLQ